MIFLTCRTHQLEQDLISKLNEEMSAEFSIQEKQFDLTGYTPLEDIILSDSYSPSHLYILSGFPFASYYKEPEAMETRLSALVSAFNLGRGYIPEKKLKLVIFCPQGVEDFIHLKAPDFYRFVNYSNHFSVDEHYIVYGEKSHEAEVNLVKIDFLLDSLREVPSDVDKADIHLELGRLFLQLHTLDEALAHFRSAENLLPQKNKKHADAIGKIGLVYLARGEFDVMIEQEEKALAAARNIAYRQGEANAVGNMGVGFYLKKNYTNALKCFQEALEIDRALGDLSRQAVSLGNIGLYYYYREHHGEASKYLAQARELYHKINIPMPDTFAYPLSELNRNLPSPTKKYQKAVIFYEDELKKVLYQVECPHHAEGEKPHVFNRIFKIEDGSEEIAESKVEARCAICDKMVQVKIKGKAHPDKWVKR